ncbi:MAG: peptidoglycan-binding protein, partial [Alphaproteobacteria bacterium]
GGFAEALIGSTIGTIIGNEIHRNATRPRTRVIVRERTRTRVVRPRIDSFTRAQNREVQVALNYFGFNSGAPDGVLGRRSRAAIRRYQALLDFPVTGHLTEAERAFLIASYNRALAGGVETERLIAREGIGVSGLLVAYNDERLGRDAPAASSDAVAPRPGSDLEAADEVPHRDASAETTEVATAEDSASETEKPGIMVFGSDKPTLSMAKFCAEIGIRSAANGGLLPASSLKDSEDALGEQFCLLDSEAIATSRALVEAVPGATAETIQATCETFLPELRPFAVKLATDPAEAMTGPLADWAAGTGASIASLTQTAQICLGHAYDTDNAEMAVSAALALVAVGQQSYGEILAAHLAQGFGVAANRSRAASWYDLSAAALESGTEPIVLVDGLDRAAFLRDAARRMRGEPVDAADALQDRPATTLTTFGKKPVKSK